MIKDTGEHPDERDAQGMVWGKEEALPRSESPAPQISTLAPSGLGFLWTFHYMNMVD